MAQTVTFNGVSYSIPEAREVGWSSLTNFLVAVGTYAQTNINQISSLRVATASPVTVASTDYAIITNLGVAGAVTVNLPVGVAGMLVAIADGKGDAATNNVTVLPNGSDTINGSASFVMASNKESLILQYNLTNLRWNVLSSSRTDLVTLATSQALTNKNLGAASNSLTGATAASFINSGTITLPTATGTLATLAGTESLTNKDYQGGTASNSSRFTLPKDTTTNINALTRKQATLIYDSTLNQVKFDNGTVLAALATSSLATPTTTGIVSSFSPTVAASVLITTNANYTMLTADGYALYAFDTGAVNRTFTLDAVANSAGRRISVKIINGTGNVTVQANGGEFIDLANTYVMRGSQDSLDLHCTGNAWQIISQKPSSRIALTDMNAAGSTNTRIFKYSTVTENVGNDITYTSSATNGDSFTINTAGTYSVNASIGHATGFDFYLLRNASTTAGLTAAQCLGATQHVAGQLNSLSCTYYFAAGDIVRAGSSSAGLGVGGGAPNDQFRIVKCS